MYAILNNEELIEPLADRVILRRLNKIHPTWVNTVEYVNKCDDDFACTGLISIDFNQVNAVLNKDLRLWKDEVMTAYKGNYRKLVNWLSANLDGQLDRNYLINLCVSDPRPSFVKSLARQIDPNPIWMLRGETVDTEELVVIRNIIGNEQVLSERIKNNLPFWFIDSGYTNFLTGKKNWHRLVKNSLHQQSTEYKFSADRLGMFSQFPRPWFGRGKTILVVESSEHHYKMLGTTLDEWKGWITKELQKHTDRPIEFKPKEQDRKTRISVHDLLKSQPKEYYCVVSDSSAAAIEAVWNGIPIITLSPHVSSPIARNSLSDINDLYCGPVGDWLCALSYSQFTKQEMFNGTALKIMRKFHGV
jgi:hypothetical protein